MNYTYFKEINKTILLIPFGQVNYFVKSDELKLFINETIEPESKTITLDLIEKCQHI